MVTGVQSGVSRGWCCVCFFFQAEEGIRVWGVTGVQTCALPVLVFPEEIADDFIGLAELCIKTSAAALMAINGLDELLGAAFSSRQRKLVGKMIKTVNELQHETDDAQNDISNKLFALESDLTPADVMSYYRGIEWLGETADAERKSVV